MTTDIATRAGNLPAEPNTFIGRERDTAELAGLLRKVKILTLCGPGGIGKTRLALRLAADLAADYADGAWLADLGGADAAELVVPLVAAAIGVREERDRTLADTLAQALQPRSMLLILDTCEHLVDACAELVHGLLVSCPGLRVVATSREPLLIRGEVIWRVPPLGLPPGSPSIPRAGGDARFRFDELIGSEAVRLFLDRAEAALPGFALEAADVASVAAVCRAVDGVPLAIELAAAWVRALSVGQIAARLADRFALLASGDRTAPRRQQTLRATVQWSFDLLTGPEQVLLRRLAVFHGWTVEMAEEVCSDSQLPSSDVLDLLAALIDKSLVVVDGELGGTARYRLLDTVREYAVDRAAAAGELSALRTAHRDCMLALLQEVADQAFVRGGRSWPQRVAMYYRVLAERANSRAALTWCAERGEADQGLRLCCAIGSTWLVGGDAADGCGWLDRLLALDQDASPGIRARALAVRAQLAFEQRDCTAAVEHARACLDIATAEPDGSAASALRTLALVARSAGHPAEALARAEEAVGAAKAASDDWQLGLAQTVRAFILVRQSRLDEAQLAYEIALDVLRDNNSWAVAQALYGLGRLARIRGDDAAALRYFDQVLDIYRQIGSRPELARCLAEIGSLAISRRDLGLARSSLLESLQVCLVTGRRRGAVRVLAALAVVAMTSGDLPGALRLAGASLAQGEAVDGAAAAQASPRLRQLIKTATGRLGKAAASALLAEGRAMSTGAVAARVVVTAPEQLPAAADPQVPAGSDQLATDQLATGQLATGQLATGQPLAVGRLPAGLLTERERQVAALIAGGLSNQAIASELQIRPSTAARHVANIFAKLGFNSRGQVQAWMADGHAGG